MRNLPVSVSEQEIEEMFAIADTDRDDKISYEVNQTEMSLSATWISQPKLQKRAGWFWEKKIPILQLILTSKNIKHNCRTFST